MALVFGAFLTCSRWRLCLLGAGCHTSLRGLEEVFVAKLENWSFTRRAYSDPYTPPECAHGYTALYGTVTGHPDLPDGSTVTTSELVSFTMPAMVAVTRNTVYELGHIDPNFVAWMKREGHKLKDYLPSPMLHSRPA